MAAVLESYCHLSGDLSRDGKFLIWITDMAGHVLARGWRQALPRLEDDVTFIVARFDG